MLWFLSVVLLAASAQAQPALDVASIKPSDRIHAVPYRRPKRRGHTQGT